jgi:hypothetical protein
MTADIDPAPTPQDLANWFNMKAELARLKSAEAMLRSRIFKHYFPTPIEGTNTAELGDGTGAQIKATHVINRDIDEGALDAFSKSMKEAGSNQPQLPLGLLVEWKPRLVLKQYRELTEEERNAFDQCLIIKPGSPQMEIKIPKKPG